MSRGGGKDDIVDKRHQINLVAYQRLALVEPGQRQKVLHQPSHTGALLSDSTHCVVELRSFSQVALLPQLKKPLDGCHWGSQFVRRIGYELTEPGFECLLFIEHDVEGSSQMRGFGA